ncbi:VOC family protein [Mycolicibacterium goodii]|uniref:VOC family protein n=1 Tax=Mycolicibacterium goodii TaxID=134601 RepID=A0ABS6HU11_MYCGD|nr:VOC family protein [Mycolicibacterium goodii]OKH75258.1 glyoxalase [Mycobacterium sp. SWH-M5]MBU8807461.1 VOC family protein [Mycolicibacterium goodii]MBU8814458.1 VOC family protein [Mycolicibacterium goodii]MBU8824843.1 VOC family protein [Mycolicibacterium goodii]MBU8829000.1 VOC family protein [Mycolicibacterium goodii]
MAGYSLGHAGINVTDLSRSKSFYQAVFGFDVLREHSDGDKRFAFLGADGELAVTLWEQSSGVFATDRPGLHHLAFLVDDIDAVRAAEARVRDAGAEILHGGVVPHQEGASSGGIFFTDPDGTRIEIYATSGADAMAGAGAAPFGDAPTCGFF